LTQPFLTRAAPIDLTDVSLPNLPREIEIETQDWFKKPGLHAVWHIAPEPRLYVQIFKAENYHQKPDHNAQ
jgi:hypothetical protein